MVKPTATPHVDYLDGWRGLAIVFLLIGHFFPVPGINLGRVGVDLFFVLSGLLMSRLLFVKATPLPLFYKRRISRVFPSFFVFIALSVVLAWCFHNAIDWKEVALAALFLNNYFSGDSVHSVMPFGHIWSLAVEEQSYVLLSLVALCVRRGWCRAMTALTWIISFCATASLVYWFFYTSEKLEFEIFYHTEVAGYGIFISAFFLLFFQTRPIPRLPALCYPALGLVALAFFWWSVPVPIGTLFGVGTLALLVNLLPQAPASIHSLLSFAPLRQLGLWSFSIYLWQQAFYLAHHHDNLPSWLGISLALLAGICSFYLLEKPAREYINAHWAKQNQ